MAETRVVAHLADGGEVDVTEAVQTLYDLVTGSMDWGSGFLTVEDALPVVHIAKTCGFEGYEEAERYVQALTLSEEQRKLQVRRRQEEAERREEQARWLREHEHVYSDKGRCVYPQCRQQGPVFSYELSTKGADAEKREQEWVTPEGYTVRVRFNGALTSEVIAALEERVRADARPIQS